MSHLTLASRNFLNSWLNEVISDEMVFSTRAESSGVGSFSTISGLRAWQPCFPGMLRQKYPTQNLAVHPSHLAASSIVKLARECLFVVSPLGTGCRLPAGNLQLTHTGRSVAGQSSYETNKGSTHFYERCPRVHSYYNGSAGR